MSTTTQEMARGWRRYFTTQDSPRLSPEIASVVIMEDLTKGPYPPSRLFQIGGQNAAVVGEYSVTTIRNTGGRGSVVVVDRIIVHGSGQLLVSVRTESYALANNGGSKVALDRAPEALAKSYNSGELFIGDVKMSYDKSPAAVAYDTITPFPALAGTQEFWTQVDGPWIIGQGGEMAVHSSFLQRVLDVFAIGRYYTLS